MKIYICANEYTKKQSKQLRKCFDALNKLGHNCSTDELINNFYISDADLVVSLGGDGALLKAAKVALKYNKPLIGINSGRLGFLCATSFNEIDKFDDVFKQCDLEERSLLSLKFKNKNYYAINDVIISKTDFGKTVDLSIYLNNIELMVMRGDGLIISTPTGSTAYNISAGGPIIDKEGNMFAITPICAHGKSSHPYVVNDNKIINVAINHDDVGIYVDGELIGTSKENIFIKRGNKRLKLYVRNNYK